MSIRHWARNSMYHLLYGLIGPGRGVRVILLYHSVGGDATHAIATEVFERQMEVLLSRFKVIRLCDLPKAISTLPADTNLACITFDDGYLDNYDQVLPVLEHLGLKATFFIVTGFLKEPFAPLAGEYPVMNSRQVQELATLGHEIGAHTVNHPKLSKIPLETARAEIERSKHFLEDLLGNTVTSFAYPKGDYNAAVRQLVDEAGFSIAGTIQEGLVNRQPDWLALPRVWISDALSFPAFVSKLSPVVDLYARLREWRQ